MEHEKVYKISQQLHARAETCRVAGERLRQTANQLQRGDFTGFRSLNPYSSYTQERKRSPQQVRERGMAVVRQIKNVSLERMKDEQVYAEMFEEKHKGEFPLRVQLRSARQNARLRVIDVANCLGGHTSTISRFESGYRPPNSKIVTAYTQALELSQEESDRLRERERFEWHERRKHYIKKRKREEKKEDMRFGERLRILREENGISLKRLAEETGLTPSGILLIEKGVSKQPYESSLMKLLRAKSIEFPEDMLPSWLVSPMNEGEYLRYVRVRSGMFREEFAKLVRRDETSIKASESGERKPTKKTIHQYEQVLGIKIQFPDFPSGA